MSSPGFSVLTTFELPDKVSSFDSLWRSSDGLCLLKDCRCDLTVRPSVSICGQLYCLFKESYILQSPGCPSFFVQWALWGTTAWHFCSTSSLMLLYTGSLLQSKSILLNIHVGQRAAIIQMCQRYWSCSWTSVICIFVGFRAGPYVENTVCALFVLTLPSTLNIYMFSSNGPGSWSPVFSGSLYFATGAQKRAPNWCTDWGFGFNSQTWQHAKRLVLSIKSVICLNAWWFVQTTKYFCLKYGHGIEYVQTTPGFRFVLHCNCVLYYTEIFTTRLFASAAYFLHLLQHTAKPTSQSIRAYWVLYWL